MNEKELTVLMVEPGKHPKVTKIKDDLGLLQKAVSIGDDYQGLIEFVSLGNGDCKTGDGSMSWARMFLASVGLWHKSNIYYTKDTEPSPVLLPVVHQGRYSL